MWQVSEDRIFSISQDEIKRHIGPAPQYVLERPAEEVTVAAKFYNRKSGSVESMYKPNTLQKRKHQINSLAFDAQATIMPSCHHVIMSSCHHVTVSSCHHVITSSCHHACHRVIVSSCHRVIMPSSRWLPKHGHCGGEGGRLTDACGYQCRQHPPSPYSHQFTHHAHTRECWRRLHHRTTRES